MIRVSRLHDAGEVVINSDIIETIEACPDTTITLVTKRKFVVADPIDVVIQKVIDFRLKAGVSVGRPLDAVHHTDEMDKAA